MKCHIKSMTRLALFIAISVGGDEIAFAQWAVIDGTNLSQNILTAARSLQSNINQAQQIAYQLQMYKNMLQNTAALPEQVWADASGTLNQLANVAQTGQSLSYSAASVNGQFQSTFPGYKTSTDYGASYRQWSQTALDSMRGALNAAGVQNANFANEEQTIAGLRVAASGALGQKAAVDAGNQIAMAQVSQLQELRQLMMAQMQSQTAYQAQQVQSQAVSEANEQQAMKYVDPMQGVSPYVPPVGSGHQ
ncbi:P-type conjugative transfer protein TrbJ [Dyella sp. SG609]|uniref:P-type conjugative transfer protein TrbJ n=1 Tax=Dyella sp. SG609 TaxID=2587018 RepID=UPI0014484D30|nr:P-type conjugative transfer protein TrbJ [Dyella sp. SG609]NKJ23849.1 P-type conjugative transfer protein TrbJ [Dyella sp. SG609]